MTDRVAALHDLPSESYFPHTMASSALDASTSHSSRPTVTRLGSAAPRMASSVLAIRPSAAELQQHLYTSLLHGHTADISLRVRGSWEAVYRLHRVVLTQAGFFQSLFQSSGFQESSASFGKNEIEIIFDDPNITRPAFELCIARLYGGGPPLHLNPALIPSITQPLTPGFPYATSPTAIPDGHHPTTPRLLLSLIATAVYLSLPAVASQALSAVLNSVGPHTLTRYLEFACGRGIGPADEDEPEAAVGLEGLAQPVPDDYEPSLSVSGIATPGVAVTPLRDEESPELLSRALEEVEFHKEGPSVLSDSYTEVSRVERRTFDYGAVSTKVGEAVACWLARFGADVLVHEQKVYGQDPAATPVIHAPKARKVQTMMAGLNNGNNNNNNGEGNASLNVPRIWSVGGLPAKWVTAVLGSDSLFVKGEKERYELAKAVVELRRLQGVEDDEEEEWDKFFRTGIYYSNMLLEDLMQISHHISPRTKKPYVPLSVVQAAHWDQSLLHQTITSRPSGTTPSYPASPTPRENELGLAVTTPEILDSLSGERAAATKDRVYWPVPTDSSSRVGELNGVDATSMEQLFEVPSGRTDPKKATRALTSESTFFGLATDRRTASECVAADTSGKTRWSPYAPFRFGVEFWDVGSLKEKSRLHSHTIWYAGSLWNVYVQVVRKKGIQLGVYLHRQSSIDAAPHASVPLSAVPRPITNRARGLTMPTRPTPTLHTSVSQPNINRPITPRSTTPVSTAGSALVASSVGSSSASDAATAPSTTLPATAPSTPPVQPYRDPRSSVCVHFSIACQSATGSSMTRFASAPDVFSISQSWGWKSSSLRTEEFLDATAEDGPARTSAGRSADDRAQKELVSLRATVVLGIV